MFPIKALFDQLYIPYEIETKNGDKIFLKNLKKGDEAEKMVKEYTSKYFAKVR